MTSTDAKFSCCRVSTWTTVISWLQIVGAILAILQAVWWYNDPQGSSARYFGVRELVEVISTLLVVLSIFQIGFAVLLLMGNMRKKSGLLWSWIVYRAAELVLAVILGSAIAVKIAISQFTILIIAFIVAEGVISAFMVMLVHRRIKDIKTDSGGVTHTNNE